MKKYKNKYFAKVLRCRIKYQDKNATIIEANAANLNKESINELMDNVL